MDTAVSGTEVDVRALVAGLAGPECEVDDGDTWVAVRRAGLRIPSQGWKIHISARPGTLGETLGRVLPVLFAAECEFKVARSPEVLRELNTGDLDPGVVGKAITVYAAEEAVVPLGLRLAEATRGLSGPRIVSDRRLRRDAPVYYRYGPFQPQYRVDDNGDFELVVVGPDGEVLPGAAGPEFDCPPWTSDPFRPAARSGAATASAASPGNGNPGPTLGGIYRLTSGVMRGPRGSVYRAVDQGGRRLVIKEARAYVSERTDGLDIRWQIRNERRILQALEGVAGVPGLVDHFRHGEDEYLVTTEEGTTDLNRFVNENGRFFDEPGNTGR
ncbi:serine/threonine protein kinase, partial [Amycolatopsis rhizosphaerae]